jgi:DNA-binding response OmpR family regulator
MVVDDDPTVSTVMAGYLRRDGFRVEICADGLAAVASALDDPPCLVLLDLQLPGCSGLEVLRALRATGSTPVIMVTSQRDENSRVRGLQLGADDYVTKPFSPRELTARVHALLRRCTAEEPGGDVVEGGGLRVDVAEHQVRVGEATVALTSLEQALLVFLMRHAGRACSRSLLLERVWGFTHGEEAAVTVQIRRLREKVEDHPAVPRRITTVWGKGYRFESHP